jgi:hypothetical protein
MARLHQDARTVAVSVPANTRRGRWVKLAEADMEEAAVMAADARPSGVRTGTEEAAGARATLGARPSGARAGTEEAVGAPASAWRPSLRRVSQHGGGG